MNKKIALSYSKKHFKPERKSTLGGAGFLAKSIYQILDNKYTTRRLEYFDCSEVPEEDPTAEYDLLIGISSNIQNFQKRLKPCDTILFAVNFSAIARRQISKHARKRKFPKKALTWSDGIQSNLYETDGVNSVVTLGSYSNYISYLRMGMDNCQVFPISSTMGYKFEDEMGKRNKFGTDIIFFPGEISFRKGLPHLEMVLEILKKEGRGRKIRVLGYAPNLAVRGIVDKIEARYPDNFHWENEWLDLDSETWEQNLKNSKFAILPSFEEGLPTSILDLIYHNIPVLYSTNCGLDFVRKELILEATDELSWKLIIEDFLEKDDAFMSKLLIEQKKMLSLIDYDLIQFENILNRNYKRSIWPVVEIDQSLEMYIGSDSWFHFSKGEIEYLIKKSNEQDAADLIIEVKSFQKLSFEELVAIAIIQIDRYSGIMNLAVINSGNVLKVERQKCRGKASSLNESERLWLFMQASEGSNFLSDRIKLVYMKRFSQIFDSMKYRSGRMFQFLNTRPQIK